MQLRFLGKGKHNPFGADEHEQLAHALDEAGLLSADTLIDERPARDYLSSFFAKREAYRDSTRLGSLLVNRGLIEREQLAAALREQQARPGLKLGDALLALGMCEPKDLERALDTQSRIRVDLEDLEKHRRQITAIRERLGAQPPGVP